MPGQRRSYPKSFKAQVVEECTQPGASVAGVALSHGLNANLVHKWIRRQQAQLPAVPQVLFQFLSSRACRLPRVRPTGPSRSQFPIGPANCRCSGRARTLKAAPAFCASY
ncbi:transposase [Pseudomonas aeruginosa]|uniref:transposase n=1 Tax=Pseudomonas aeruginosa TaxID=287 RepID=UPI003AF31C56